MNSKTSCHSSEQNYTEKLIESCRLAMTKLHPNKVPYDEQIDAIRQLVGASEPNQSGKRGKLIEVCTGQGKSLITQIVAAVLAKIGRKVHIMTSNEFLAKRDWNEYSSYFQSLGLESTCICGLTDDSNNKRQANIKDFKQSNILIGTPNCFQFFSLRVGLCQFFSLVCEDEMGLDVVLIDEADDFLLDSFNTLPIIGGENSSPAYMNQDLEKIYEIGRQNEHDYTRMFEESLKDSSLIKLPRITLHELLEACVTSSTYEPGADFIIKNGKVVIIRQTTCELVQSQRWSKSIHEFIEIRHKLEVGKPSISLAISVPQCFLLKYKTILGVTGTLGSKEERDELKKTYSVEYQDIASHHSITFQEIGPEPIKGEQNYLSTLVKSIKHNHSQGRPILIVCENIVKCEKLFHHLITILKGVNAEDIQMALGIESRTEISSAFKKAGRSGQITVATLIAGRGVDIQLDRISLQKGGLHVLLTFFPSLQRVQRQIFGRSARQGAPGSGQIIFRCPDDWQGSTEDYLKEREEQRSKQFEVEKLVRLTQSIRGEMFMKTQQRWFDVLAEFTKQNPKVIFTSKQRKVAQDRIDFKNAALETWALKMDELQLNKLTIDDGSILNEVREVRRFQDKEAEISAFFQAFEQEALLRWPIKKEFFREEKAQKGMVNACFTVAFAYILLQYVESYWK